MRSRTALAPGLALLAAPLVAQEPLSFGVEVESVYVDAFVTHKGRPVPGLAAESFEVRDNGVRQRARLVDLRQVPVTTVLVFDTSASVFGRAMRDLRTAGHAVLDELRPGDRIALIAFNHDVRLIVGPSEHVAAVGTAIDDLSSDGGTALYDALYAALALPGSETRRLVLAFTDGADNASWLEGEDIVRAAARSEAVVHLVGVEPTGAPLPRSYLRTLEEIADATGGRHWRARDSKRLEETFVQILAEMSSRYLLAYEPAGVERPGEHRIDVRLRGARGDVRARRGYSLPDR